MKKTMIFAAVMAVAAVSCQKEKLAIEQTSSIKIAAETMPLTKVNFQDGKGPVWKAGEKASLISMTGYSLYASSELEASNIAPDGSKAWFAFESVADGTYRIVSPEPASASADGVVFNVPASQTQDILGLSGSRAYLVGGLKSGASDLADIVVSSETTSYEAFFKLAGALLQFNVYNSSNPTGEKIKSITVTPAGAKLSGSMTVAYDGKHQSSTGTGESVTVVVNNPEIVVATSEKTAKAVYAAVLPAKIDANESGSVTYTIVTDGSVYSFASKAAKNWENGNIYPVNIDLACATKVERQAPIMSSTHPKASGDLTMTQTEPGVYKIEHVWLGGQNYTINFKAGNSGFYYNAYNGDANAWVASEDPSFDLVYSNEPKALMVQQYGGKDYSEKYYTIILDTNKMKLKVQQHRGTSFWLVGDDCNWELSGKTSFDTNSDTKTASWSGYLKAGNYKIQGENTSDDGWKGEWYYPDIVGEWKYGTNTEKGVTLNSDDPDNRHWNLPEAGYYKIDFNYSDMTIQIEKVESLDIKVNDKALKYIGNNEYSITTTFTKGENFVLSGCKKLEYVMMDPDFLEKDAVTQTYKFNAVDGTYTFILHLGTHDASWTSDGQTPTNSWTLFKGINNGGTYSTMIIAGDGVANLTIKNCVGWTCESQNQPFMAEVDDNVYQFTGRYRENWSKLEPYDRWSNKLDFKYFGNTTWGNGIQNGVTLDDKTGNIQQNPEGSKDSNGKSNEGNLTWKSPDKRWDDGDTYRMTVDMTKNSQTVTFEKITLK